MRAFVRAGSVSDRQANDKGWFFCRALLALGLFNALIIFFSRQPKLFGDGAGSKYKFLFNMKILSRPWIQYPYYALIYIDADGKVLMETSPSITYGDHSIFSPVMMHNFLSAISDPEGNRLNGYNDNFYRHSNTKKNLNGSNAKSDSFRAGVTSFFEASPLMMNDGDSITHSQYELQTKLGDEKPWSLGELIVVLYFSSRHMMPSTLRCLLANRGYERTVISIEQMIKSVLDHQPSLQLPNGQWDARAVDQYIDHRLYDHESVNCVIQFSFRDAEVVANVSSVTWQAPFILSGIS